MFTARPWGRMDIGWLASRRAALEVQRLLGASTFEITTLNVQARGPRSSGSSPPASATVATAPKYCRIATFVIYLELALRVLRRRDDRVQSRDGIREVRGERRGDRADGIAAAGIVLEVRIATSSIAISGSFGSASYRTGTSAATRPRARGPRRSACRPRPSRPRGPRAVGSFIVANRRLHLIARSAPPLRRLARRDRRVILGYDVHQRAHHGLRRAVLLADRGEQLEEVDAAVAIMLGARRGAPAAAPRRTARDRARPGSSTAR